MLRNKEEIEMGDIWQSVRSTILYTGMEWTCLGSQPKKECLSSNTWTWTMRKAKNKKAHVK